MLPTETPPTHKKAIIYRDSYQVELTPSSPEAEKHLTFTERQMVKKGHQIRPEFNEVKLYEPTQTGLRTYPGVWRGLQSTLLNSGWEVEVRDKRNFIPTPDLSEVAKAGLRFSQPMLVTKALCQRTSGLLGAPTRYGKTYMMLAIAAAFKKYRVVVVAPGEDLVTQLYEDFTERFPDKEVVMLGCGSRKKYMSDTGITVCSADSMHKLDKGMTDVLLIDEPHAFVTNARASQLSQFTKALRIGFGATLEGRFDFRDPVITALIGPVLSSISYREAVAEGAIAECWAVFFKHKFSFTAFPQTSRDGARRAMLFKSTRLGEFVREVDKRTDPGWQVMHFIENEVQAEHFSMYLPKDNQIMMAKKLTKTERKAKTDRIKLGDIARILCSKIFIQGVTFPQIRILNNLAGGGASTGAIQKPGRLLQLEGWKNYGLLLEHMFECTDSELDKADNPAYQSVIGEAWSRYKLYNKIGYKTLIVDDMDELEEIIKNSGGPIPLCN